MKKLFPALIILFSVTLQVAAQKKQSKVISTKISLTPEKWVFKEGKVEFSAYKGRPAMKLSQGSGQVVLKDVNFKDGTIEYDVDPDAKEFAAAIYFHRKNEKEQEIVYLRVARIGNKLANEAIQYTPYFDGVNMWDMYPQYQSAAMAKSGEWNHMKLVMAGQQMRVFVNNELALSIPKLEGRETEGSIAFEGVSWISNVEVKPGETEGLAAEEGVDITRHEANYIRDWSVTQPSPLPPGNEPTTAISFPKNESFNETIEAERYGLVNLTRRFGGNDKRKLVWLKATITTEEAVNTNMQLGFSDEIWLYLNDQITYTDKNFFLQNMKKYPAGRISIQNGTTVLNLKKGENQLMIGVANDFYGWGIMARLESTDKIIRIEPYKAPPKIVIENISQYPGVYTLKDGDVKITITESNGDLIAKAVNQEPFQLRYTGNDRFVIDKIAVELQFKPAEKKFILKENGTESEFLKDK